MKNRVAIFVFSALGATGWAQAAPAQNAEAKIKALEAKLEELKPGLGEIMCVIQQHHAKLYFSINAANWDLASYQLDEIGEGFDDVVKYYPHFKEVKTPLAELVPTFIKPSLLSLESALKKKDKSAALKYFGDLTAGCNGCHASASHPFISIQLPHGEEFTNQRFSP